MAGVAFKRHSLGIGLVRNGWGRILPRFAPSNGVPWDDTSKTTRAERVYGREKRSFFCSLHGRRDAPAWAEADSKKSRLEIPSPGAGASVAGRSPAS